VEATERKTAHSIVRVIPREDGIRERAGRDTWIGSARRDDTHSFRNA
jgi:hypothetical protein